MAKRRGNGEGSISKRKRIDKATGKEIVTWQGYITVGYDPETGKDKRKYFYGATRKEVQEKVNDAAGQVNRGTFQEPSKEKLGDWLNTWLNDYMKPSLRTTTWESYKTQADSHIIPALGHIRLNQLQTSHLQKLYNEKLQGGRADNKPGGLSPRSVRYIHIVIHAALEQAKREGKVAINPADAAKLPKNEKKEISCMNTADIVIFLSTAKDTRYFPLYFLALNTGLRRGELLGLRWKDVDMENGTVTINQGLVRTKEGLVFQQPKTKLSKRTICISEEVINTLITHRGQQEAEKRTAGKEAYQDNNLVFCNELGGPLCPRALTRHFERLLKRAGLPKITFHGLRHTFATTSLEQGIDIKTTQENLGHHSAAFTLDVYSSVSDKMKKNATDKIGGLMAELLKQE